MNQLIAMLMVTMSGLTAHAAAGTLTCVGKIQKKDVTVEIVRNDKGDTTRIAAFGDGRQEATFFERKFINFVMLNMGTESEPFMNSALLAYDGVSALSIRIPEQGPGKVIVLVKGNLVAVGAESSNESEFICDQEN